MDEIVKLVAQKTGMSEPIARMAVETVVNYIKGKLPESIAGHLDSVVGGGSKEESGGLGGLGDIVGGLGGLLK